jgi:hypothetical protein
MKYYFQLSYVIELRINVLQNFIYNFLCPLFRFSNFLKINIPIQRRCDYQRKGRKGHIIATDIIGVKSGLSTNGRLEREIELGHREKHVLVEKVQNHVGDADVVLSPVNEK